MWICGNDFYLSIVSKDCKPSELLVRARRPGDIEKVFPEAKVTEYDKSDYQFRAVVSRAVVEQAMIGEIRRIVYSNFKSSVRDRPLHDAYMQVWTTMAKLQPKAPYSGFSSQARAKGALSGFADLFYDDFGAEALKPKPKQQKPKLDAQSKKNIKKLTRGQ